LGSRDDFEDGEWKGRVGRIGEDLAVKFLRREGMKVLRRNFRGPKGGEVDVVCREGDVLAFVEVKTRTTLDFGRPAVAVNKGKQRLITRGAMAWMRMLDYPDINFRFDIVEVLASDGEVPEMNLIRNAFTMPAPYRY
jgi:putative endonuclease